MFRTLVITLLNIALPFIIRALYIYGLRIIAKRKNKKGIKDVTPPEWTFPVKKLVLIGLMLSVISVGITRFFFVEIDAPYVGNISKSETLK